MDPKEITKAVIDKFNSIAKKKMINDNWTVLAGIVKSINTFFDRIDNPIECVSLATGVKCLPESKLLPNGLLINDSHAEVLCRRAFKRYLLEQIGLCNKGTESIVKVKDGMYSIDGIDFSLYISHAPCGDASMIALDQLQPKTDTINHSAKKQRTSYNDISNTNVIRGRDNFELLGKLRTKPARLDAESTLSHSCSDKIAKWNALGINGALLSKFLQPIHFQSIIIGELFNQSELDRSLLHRTNIKLDLYETKYPQILEAPISFEFSKDTLSKRGISSPKTSEQCNILTLIISAFNWIKGGKLEVIVNGMKQGASLKNLTCKTSSRLSKFNIYSLYIDVLGHELDQPVLSYYAEKQTSEKYQEAKQQFQMQWNIDPYINLWGISSYGILEGVMVILYSIIGIAWFLHLGLSKSAEIKKIPLFKALSLLFFTAILEQIATLAAQLAYELEVTMPYPIVLLFLSNLFFLWNISYRYTLMVLVSKGWCITKVDVTRISKQQAFLVGSGLMIVEIMLIGRFQIQMILYAFVYVLLTRFINTELQSAQEDLNLQRRRLMSNQNPNASMLKALDKKSNLLRRFVTHSSIFMFSRLCNTASRYSIAPFYAFTLDQFCLVVYIISCAINFRVRIPEVVKLNVLPNGRLVAINENDPAVAVKQNHDIEMGELKDNNKDDTYVILTPVIKSQNSIQVPCRPDISLATLIRTSTKIK
ncbi:hypothetical protein BC833DRAFT_645314 [Globomyces pollinis-pini]|nr:hypothetical protein BC833DRAFT_645314 [Globomyces pollinis-pini]